MQTRYVTLIKNTVPSHSKENVLWKDGVKPANSRGSVQFNFYESNNEWRQKY